MVSTADRQFSVPVESEQNEVRNKARGLDRERNGAEKTKSINCAVLSRQLCVYSLCVRVYYASGHIGQTHATKVGKYTARVLH